jgi:hypothetical protein
MAAWYGVRWLQDALVRETTLAAYEGAEGEPNVVAANVVAGSLSFIADPAFALIEQTAPPSAGAGSMGPEAFILASMSGGGKPIVAHLWRRTPKVDVRNLARSVCGTSGAVTYGLRTRDNLASAGVKATCNPFPFWQRCDFGKLDRTRQELALSIVARLDKEVLW